MKRGWLASALLLSVICMVVLIFLVHLRPTPHRFQKAGQLDGNISEQAQPIGKNAVPKQLLTRLGPLQKGVDRSQATVTLEEATAPDFPAFTKKEFTIHVGDIVSFTFRNNSLPKYNYHHSWVLVKPNRAREVGVEAAKQAGPRHGFIPDSPDILAHTKLLAPGQSETIVFRAPDTPGDYPFICLFPGHFQQMKGVLHVKSK